MYDLLWHMSKHMYVQRLCDRQGIQIAGCRVQQENPLREHPFSPYDDTPAEGGDGEIMDGQSEESEDTLLDGQPDDEGDGDSAGDSAGAADDEAAAAHTQADDEDGGAGDSQTTLTFCGLGSPIFDEDAFTQTQMLAITDSREDSRYESNRPSCPSSPLSLSCSCSSAWLSITILELWLHQSDPPSSFT